MKNPILKWSIYILLSSLALFATSNVWAQAKFLIKNSDKGIEVIYNGKTRLSGGKPLIQNRTNDLKKVEPSSSSFIFHFQQSPDIKAIFVPEGENIWGMRLSLFQSENRSGKEFAGFFFDQIPEFKTGVEIWRYKPWNSWTKPIRVSSPSGLQDWDIQFFYWRYDDGLYGAAIPLSGNGYRTTLGSEDGKFGCKAFTYTDEAPATDIPMMAVGFGNNSYQLFESLYAAGLKMMGKSENLRTGKVYPESLEYIGWCTWNSSEMGKHLDEEHLLAGTKTFTDQNFPLGWLLIDDGWFDQDGNRLNAFTPNREKFPDGFKSLNTKLKSETGLKYVGIWHAYDGYWNGINPDSELGRRYQNELFQWAQNERVDAPSKTVTYSFIKPGSDSLKSFYDHWHRYLKSEGFDFVKVDNQLVTERMCVANYPVDFLAEKMHQALYASTFKNFGGAVINCMDMTNDAFYNFGKSAVARTVEDYFPEREGGIGYKLEKGGPAAHVLMALYNSLYFSQMVYTDFDMFESNHTFATFHAAARAISGGPVYVTDIPGKQQFDVLWPLIDADGRIIRADKPAMLTEDCLFQLQDEKPIKAFSFAGKSGLMAVFNVADADQVEGTVSPSEINGLEGDSFAVYEFYSKEISVLKKNDTRKISLNRMGNKYFNFVPIKNGIALIGLVNKYNAPKTIIRSKIENKKIEVTLLKGNTNRMVRSVDSDKMTSATDGGNFMALLPVEPVSVFVNDSPVGEYSYKNGVFSVNVKSRSQKETNLEINLK